MALQVRMGRKRRVWMFHFIDVGSVHYAIDRSKSAGPDMISGTMVATTSKA